MTAAQSKVFIVGPGFIGWNILELLVAEKYSVTGLVRRPEHAAGIERSGAKAVLGDLNDNDLIREYTRQSDIIFHTATADHLPSVEAILQGINDRASSNLKTVYIHTSGSSLLKHEKLESSRGDYIYRDDVPEDIDSVPDDAPHRAIDLTIIRGQTRFGDAAKIAIMIPPEIYGMNLNNKRLSIQIPRITRYALKHGFAPFVGKGQAIESAIHVLDLARAYVTILHWIERSESGELLTNPYFFCENGMEFRWKDAGDEIGKAMFAEGYLQSAESRTVTEKSWEEMFGKGSARLLKYSSRHRAVRLRQMGWEAQEMGIWEAFREEELPQLLSEGPGKETRAI